MSYNEVFGGATLYPAGQTYLALTFSTDQSLSWPIEQQVGGNIVASIIDLDPTASGLNVDMPDARQASNGIQSVFNNVGSNTVTIRDATGGTIISLAPGEAWVAYLADNSTEAGTWRIFQLGASVSVANASALAGAGLKAIGSTLNQRMAPTSTAVTPITWTDSDRAQLTIWTGGVGVLDLPSPGTVGSDWFAMVRNEGSGDLTLTPPSGTIDGSATLGMASGESAIVVTDGTNFFTVGYGQSSSSVFDFIEINVAGSGDYTLSGVELNRISYRFTGLLTGNRNIIVPGSVQQYWVDNSTTGAFSLFVKTAPQITPIEVLQGDRNILYCDGTDVVDAESSTVTFPIVVAQGGTGATTAGGAQVNLSVPPNTRLITAGLGLTGGGDLSSDRTLNIGAGTGITVNADDIEVDIPTLNPLLDHNALLNRVASEHVDHTAVSLLAGTGIQSTGLGDLSANRTINAEAAAEGQVGVAEIATLSETVIGTDDARIVTPLKLREYFMGGVFIAKSWTTDTTFSNISFRSGVVGGKTSLTLPTGFYAFKLYMKVSQASAAPDIKIRFAFGGGFAGSGDFNMACFDATTFSWTDGQDQGLFTPNTDFNTTLSTVGTGHQLTIEGAILVSTEGTISFQGAQVISSSFAATVEAGYFTFHRVAEPS